MTVARSFLIVALFAAVGVSLAVILLMRNETRETEEPEVSSPVETPTALPVDTSSVETPTALPVDASPVETSTALPVVAEIDSIDQIVDLLESVPRADTDTKVIFSPTYVPDGFELDESMTFSEGYFGSHYIDDDRFLFLALAREPFYHLRPEIEQGHVEEVTVNGQSAYLVRGDWVTVYPSEQAAPFEYWDSEISLSIYLSLGDSWFLISVGPVLGEHGFDEIELLKVAESMEHIEDVNE